MTRINVVSPAELHTKHLVAEYRELPRIFALAAKAAARGELPNDARNPTRYTLGTGHVRFFYSRLGYLRARQSSLIAEMKARGFNPSFGEPERGHLPSVWHGHYEPTPDAIAINRERIELRRPRS